jgi:signal transduction histidine kinase
VVRHAKADEVRLRFDARDRELRLVVADNGRGLPQGERTENMSGISNMRARIEKMGGRFEIESAPERGTVIQVRLPLSEKS